jgi:hypothetical protein
MQRIKSHRIAALNNDKKTGLVRDIGDIDDAYWLRFSDDAITVPPLAVKLQKYREFDFVAHWAELACESVFFAIGGRWIAAKSAIRHRADGHVCFDSSAHDYQHCPIAARDQIERKHIASAEAL